MKTMKNPFTYLLVFALFLGTALNASAEEEKKPYVSVQTTAQREVMPDELTLSITIKENDYKGKKTLQEKQQELIKVLKQNKVDYEENLSIRQMGSTAKFKVFSKNPIGRTEATYYLKLTDAAVMQQVVQDLEECHITNINLVQTRYTQSDALKLELCQEAAKKAKKEAEALAMAVGQPLGKALMLNSWMTNNSPRPRMLRAYASSMNDMAEAAPQEFTPNITGITYTVTVSAHFELK